MESNKLLKFISLLCMLMLLTACFGSIRSWPVITGQVLEAETNKPIEGAIVVALWDGTKSKAFVDTQSVCYHVESTTTDKNGRYEIPVWDEGLSHYNIRNKGYSVNIFKPGYQKDKSTYFDANQNKRLYFLKPKGTREEYFEYIRRFPTSCYRAGDSKKNLYQIRKAKYEEARHIANTEDEHRTIEKMLYKIERIEYDYETATKRHYERLEAMQ